MSTLDRVAEKLVALLSREGTLTRKQIVDMLAIDNRRCYDIMGVLGAIPFENPLVTKSTNQDLGTDVYEYTAVRDVDFNVELQRILDLIQEEEREITLLGSQMSSLQEINVSSSVHSTLESIPEEVSFVEM